MDDYNYGLFGDISGMKFVFPSSNITSGPPKKGKTPHLWYISYKNGCGLDDDCAYNLTSINDSGSRVKALIQHEMEAGKIEGKNVFLAGFSQGA